MKKCSKCGIEKSEGEFYKCSSNKDGLQNMCKVCAKAYNKNLHDRYRQAKLLTPRENLNSTKRCCRCKIEKDEGEFYKDAGAKDGLQNMCKVCAKAYDNKYRQANPDYHKTNHKEYYQANPDKVKAIYRKAMAKKRSTPMGKLNKIMGCLIYKSLKGAKNGHHWVGLVGYDEEELMAHLESKFEPGMSWGNYGARHKKGFRTWVVDHTIPVSSFHFTSPDDPEFKQCWALSNLRPLWEDENLRKGDLLPNGVRGRHIRAQKMLMASRDNTPIKTTFSLDLSK